MIEVKMILLIILTSIILLSFYFSVIQFSVSIATFEKFK